MQAMSQSGEKRPWFMQPHDCDRCTIPGKPQHHPPCGNCKRNPMNVGATKRLHDHFHSKVGDDGDCGNWAIAFQRKYGGKLHAIWDRGEDEDEPEILGHVVVLKEGLVHDVYGALLAQSFFERVNMQWGYYPGDLMEISEAEIFRRLKKTSEARITELIEVV
jgi:hypothetical protein